ncbi:MAG TPA: glycosyltransferase [Ignavibacteriaceae bacterium]|nr:glycosyltransferase [Ignavibacteriaceae bacterium]
MSNPLNKTLVSAFVEAYEKITETNEEKKCDENERLIYLKAKWLHEKQNWGHLNKIGRIYLNKSNLRMSFMCLAESLRINPNQQDIFEIVRDIKGTKIEKVPLKLLETQCKVSVIMRTYKRHEYIKEAIESVLSQTFKDFELLIINDGGDDEIKEIVDSFNSAKIRYFKLHKNKGPSGALNEGILRAKGEYIAYLDDDDIYYPNHLETLINCIDKNGHCAVVYSNAWWCYGERQNFKFIELSRKLNNGRPVTFTKDMLFKWNYISTLNILHKKTCIEKVGLFSEDLIVLEDWDMWMRLANEYRFYQINEMTGEYRWHDDNRTNEKLLDIFFLESIMIPYYQLDGGKIALIKAYIHQGNKMKSEQIYSDILENYDHMVKTTLLMKELFHIANHISKGRHSVNITRDYFWFEGRDCLREIVKKGRSYKLFYIIDLMFLKIMKSLTARSQTYLKETLKNIK